MHRIPTIGEKLLLDQTTLVHIQDRNLLNQTAKVGVPDANGLIWETTWVEFDRLTKNPTD